jgi:serine/threonine protein kinase/tetratricopeptide (TPR) repeat protein
MSERDLFVAALQIADPAERAAWLDRQCANDAALRRRLEGLLQALDQAGSLLENPVVAPPATPPDKGQRAPAPDAGEELLLERPGTVIGHYKLLEQIGEGGFGVVFLAEQTQPVRRKVALKVLKPGMDTRQVVARFEAERQALALMDHPHIAKVFDGGATALGRPYFVMELVKGVPITEFCDRHQLTPRQRLELFVSVCQAVQHAHQKGIIHRDLKPSNLLVSRHDTTPTAKVIDFGVAKALDQALTDKTLFTGIAQIVGTPLYMSPEQAGMSDLDVDTRSDIYSLGVLLYELLTGTTPFPKERFKQAAYDEIRRIIREEEPPKPSTRLSESKDSLPSISAQRQTEPAKLTKLVRGELDWIVMKALEKDRSRRYDTANAFALDVQSYLADGPVLACPPSVGYRLRKFARRHRAAVGTAAAILFVLVAGIVGTTFGLIRAEHRRAEAEQARGNEAAQRQIAEAEKKKAEQAEEATLADYRASTDDAIEQLIGSRPDLGPQEKTYLENTLKRWQAFAARQGEDERSQAIRAEGHFRVASLWQKLGRRDEARAEYEAARDLYKQLAAAFPAVPRYQQDLASAHGNLGSLLAGLGQREAARTEYEADLDLLKKLAEAFPTVPRYQQDLAHTHNNLGVLLAALGQREAARTEYETARDLYKKLAAAFPAVPRYQQDLASAHGNLGALLTGLGQRDAARTELEAARDLLKKLTAAFPAVPQLQYDLAGIHNNLGSLLADLGQRDAARTEVETARDLYKKLVAAFPAVPEYQWVLACTHDNLGVLLSHHLGHRDAARAELEAARDLLQKLAAAFPAVPQYQVALGRNYCNFGILVRDEGRPADSLPWFDLAIRTLTPVYEQDRRHVTAKEFLRTSHWSRALAYDQLKKHAEAVKDWDKVIELSPEPEQPGCRARRVNSRLRAGQVVEAVAEVEELTKAWKWSAEQWYDFACVYAVASGQMDAKKEEYADRAMELLRQAVKAGFKDAAHLGKDTDLDALRDRADFMKLVMMLEGNRD